MTEPTNNTPTPDGWERRGPCFIREHGGKLAVIEYDLDDGDWYVSVHIEAGFTRDPNWCPLPDAAAWANDQLGIPKAVEVVEREFADGSRTFGSIDGKRSAYVYPYFTSWRCLYGTNEFMSRDHHEVVETARKYVWGDA